MIVREIGLLMKDTSIVRETLKQKPYTEWITQRMKVIGQLKDIKKEPLVFKIVATQKIDLPQEIFAHYIVEIFFLDKEKYQCYKDLYLHKLQTFMYNAYPISTDPKLFQYLVKEFETNYPKSSYAHKRNFETVIEIVNQA